MQVATRGLQRPIHCQRSLPFGGILRRVLSPRPYIAILPNSLSGVRRYGISYTSTAWSRLGVGIRPLSTLSTKPLKLDYGALETKWKKYWASQRALNPTTTFTSPPSPDAQLTTTPVSTKSADPFYILAMFPYPSGILHMGHVRVYTIADTLARVSKMQGRQVIHPMAWDAFGLPAENAALERRIPPAQWTTDNIRHMKQQLGLILADLDWDREFATCQPEYYRWTQALFVQLYRAGLVYQKEALVNWDPVDHTVLANEQVDKQGRSWRSGALVEKKKLKQWFIRITDYAEQLLGDLDLLTQWPERVKQMQRNWIGKSVGAEFDFYLRDQVHSENPPGSTSSPEATRLSVFTSRPDTLYGVSYLAIAADHPLVNSTTIPTDYQAEVREFAREMLAQRRASEQPEQSKAGCFTGLYVTHPLTQEPLPMYVAAYILGDYGTGVVMGVPAHDTRDWEFAQENHIPDGIKFVVEPPPSTQSLGESNGDQPWLTPGVLNHRSGPYSGLTSHEAMQRIVQDARTGGFGRSKVQYKLRDWLVSRQRYWGAPIPIVHCKNCGTVPVPESQLPVELPTEVHLAQQRGGSPLVQAKEWQRTTCPQCHRPAQRDTDTMDTFVDSSWYFLRFLDPHNTVRAFDPLQARRNMPVDMYIGGVEHAILHLLYARFISKFLWTKGYYGRPTSPKALDPIDQQRGEPFTVLLTQGMVHGRTFKDPQTGKYLKPDEVDLSKSQCPLVKATGQPAAVNHEKMSKSKHNGVDPKTIIQTYGADCTRLYVLYKAPPQEVLEWDNQSIVGMQRWLTKIGRLVQLARQSTGTIDKPQRNWLPKVPHQLRRLPSQLTLTAKDQQVYQLAHQTIQQVTEELVKTYSFNTVIAALIKFTNALTQQYMSVESPTSSSLPLLVLSLSYLLRMLAPLAPCIAEEYWSQLFFKVDSNSLTPPNFSSILQQPWPQVDPAALRSSTAVCVIQINGKTRFTLNLDTALLDHSEELLNHVEATPQFGKYCTDRAAGQPLQIKKRIVVKNGRLINYILTK
ncbi:Leucyl-tRNA synthetase, mitochondrial [Dispira simplex]|nr:Leucyl-tRNA synthetase, mitochondrial [Dispira simplex]